MIYPTFR